MADITCSLQHLAVNQICSIQCMQHCRVSRVLEEPSMQLYGNIISCNNANWCQEGCFVLWNPFNDLLTIPCRLFPPQPVINIKLSNRMRIVTTVNIEICTHARWTMDLKDVTTHAMGGLCAVSGSRFYTGGLFPSLARIVLRRYCAQYCE